MYKQAISKVGKKSHCESRFYFKRNDLDIMAVFTHSRRCLVLVQSDRTLPQPFVRLGVI